MTNPSLAEHVVVVTSQSKWHEPPRIRHQVTRQMARFTRVVFVEIPYDWHDRAPTMHEEVAPNITRLALRNPHRIPRRAHLYCDPLRTRLNKHHLRDLFGSGLTGEKPVLINFAYDFSEAMTSPQFAAAIYYCNDEFTSWAPDAIARRLITRRERATASAADRCLTVSIPLTEKLLRWNPRTETLLPGHEFAERRPVPRREGPIRIAFMGYLNERLHYDWLIAAAKQPDIEVQMIGPVERESDGLRELKALPSVTMPGPKVGAELQDALLDADVLLLPYRATRESGMLAASAPNKLYTYLAVAKPIVTTALPALVSMEDGILYRVNSAEEFVAAVRRAFADDSEALRDRRLSIARDNTWNARGDVLRSMIESDLKRKQEARG